jgi:hypothetical protein
MARSRQSSGAGAPHLQANVAELRALAHPLRLRIMELFAEARKRPSTSPSCSASLPLGSTITSPRWSAPD